MATAGSGYDDDAVLVAALRRRDEGAFAWLLDRHGPGLRRVARRHLSTDASADEVVAETWLAVIDGIERFEGRSSVKTWLYRILVNRARSRGRREARVIPAGVSDGDQEDPTDRTAFPAESFRPRFPYRGHWARTPAAWEEEPGARLAGQDTLAVVAAAIDLLPERQRTVMVLRDVEGWGPDEVCDVLELSEGNQRVLLHRARARVRAALAAALVTEGDP